MEKYYHKKEFYVYQNMELTRSRHVDIIYTETHSKLGFWQPESSRDRMIEMTPYNMGVISIIRPRLWRSQKSKF